MTASPASQPLPTPGTPKSEVRVYDRVTRYHRLGSGHPLILLTARPLTEALWPAVLTALAARSRIYVPEIPASSAELTGWLCGFMEGVGAESISLVGEGELCIPALEFALVETDRVERLLLVPSGRSEDTGLEGAVGNNGGPLALPIMLLRREHPEGAALDLVTTFFDQSERVTR